MSAYGDHCDSRSADCVGAAQGIDLVQFLADGVGKDIVSDARDETDPHPTVRQTFLDLGLEGIHLELKGLSRLHGTAASQRLKMKVNSDLTIICVAGLRLLIGSGGPAPREYRVAQPFLLLLVRHGEIPFAKADNHSIVQSHIVRLLVNSLDLTVLIGLHQHHHVPDLRVRIDLDRLSGLLTMLCLDSRPDRLILRDQPFQILQTMQCLRHNTLNLLHLVTQGLEFQCRADTVHSGKRVSEDIERLNALRLDSLPHHK